jgi:hypothetical protein
VKEALQYLGNLGWKTSTDPDTHHEKLLDVSKLGPLGTFDVSNTAPAPFSGETGASLVVPITVSRSSTFFERVGLKLGSIPSGWTATLDNTSLLGWTAKQTSLRLTLPKPTPSGTYHITVTGTNQNRSEATTVNIVVENDLPIAKAAVASIVTTSQVGSTTAPVTLAWPSATDATSAIAGYEVQLRKNGGAWGSTTSTKPSVRSLTKTLAFDASYDIRVRARDGAGNWSQWVQTPSSFHATVVDDRRTSIAYSASWVKTTSTPAIGDTLRLSRSLGAKINYTFTGRGISVVAPTGAGRASLAVRIDGTLVKTVSLKTSSTHHRRVVFTTAFASSGTHQITLEIVTSGSAQLDAFVVAK